MDKWGVNLMSIQFIEPKIASITEPTILVDLSNGHQIRIAIRGENSNVNQYIEVYNQSTQNVVYLCDLSDWPFLITKINDLIITNKKDQQKQYEKMVSPNKR